MALQELQPLLPLPSAHQGATEGEEGLGLEGRLPQHASQELQGPLGLPAPEETAGLQQAYLDALGAEHGPQPRQERVHLLESTQGA